MVQRWGREKAEGPGVITPPDQGPGFFLWRVGVAVASSSRDQGAHEQRGLCGALEAGAARGKGK